jgi:hypothetical protein
MKKVNEGFFVNTSRIKFLLFILALLQIERSQAQCPTFVPPQLFGLSQTAIYCKDVSSSFGVFNSAVGQVYYFSVYNMTTGAETRKRGGPLDGNGGTLSVALTIPSSKEAGEYRVRSYNDCGQKDSVSYYVYYGNIDNLTITAWGSSAVTFRWAASGPKPDVTYEYAVTTDANPSSGTITYTPTTDTFATKTGLTNNTVYYIHVRVKEVFRQGNPVDYYFNCNGELPYQTLKFTACSATASVGSISPAYNIACTGSSVTLTATGGSTRQWYGENNIAIGGATGVTYVASTPQQYRLYITTPTACQGMVASATVMQTAVQTGVFSGSGDFYSGDTVRLGISNTIPDHTYKIMKDGVEVYSMTGIGKSNETYTIRDTMWYNFAITSAGQAGHYTVNTFNPYCSAVSFGDVTVNYVTANTICPGGNTSFNFSSVGANNTFQWQVDPGTGFVNVTNNAPYSGATTKTLILTNPPNNYYGYKYRCVATGSASPATSSNRILKFGVTWLGTTSTAWATATNWSCGVAPNANTDVIVQPAALPSTNQPVISSNITCRNVWVKPGGNLKINTGFKLTITP